MEEVKKKNKKIFYLMLGLSILLIGGLTATFAYFSASSSNTGTITGTTNNTNGTLTINVSRLGLNPSPAPASDDLVPADFGVTPNNMTTTLVNNALTAKCVDNGYTGCHVWKITATSTQTVSTANIRLSLTLPTVVDKNEWSYVVYTGSDSSSSNIVYKGRIIESFPNDVTTLDIHNGGGLTANTAQIYYVMVYLNNVNSSQNDGTTTGTTNATGRYNGSVTFEAMGGEVRANFLEDAAEYITNLYTNASKSTATVNSITYSLASSVGLMRDQFGSSSSASNTGNLRYYGADPSNYVWLGDNYIEDITQEVCYYSSFPPSCFNFTKRQAGDKKLWRIVGVFDGRLKLISNDPISTTNLSWDTSANTTGGNAGYGINQWGPSDTYEGADIMRLLNPGYEGESINNSLYWTKGTGTVYTGSENATTSNVSFANTGLTANERNMIDTATWYTGAYDQVSYADAHYTAERGNMGKICTQGTTYCDDIVTRTNTWNGKVGLISASDYGYSADLSQCNQTLGEYYNCSSSNWLSIERSVWTMSSRAHSDGAASVFGVSGYLDDGQIACYVYLVRPAVFLKSGMTISGGNGSQSDPYVLSY